MSTLRLALLYTAFAALATGLNLGTQRLVLALAKEDPEILRLIAQAAGTGIGLGTKYLLDKRFIFADLSRGLRAHAERFPRYTLMGLGTTALFLAVQWAAWSAIGTEAAWYVGGGLGLGLGYTIKYQLDKRFVFTTHGTDPSRSHLTDSKTENRV